MHIYIIYMYIYVYREIARGCRLQGVKLCVGTNWTHRWTDTFHLPS